MNSFLHNYGFSIFFFVVLSIFSIVDVPEKFEKPLSATMIILLSCWCVQVGIIKNSHIAGIKTVLLQVFFPIMVFTMLTGSVDSVSEFVAMLKYPALSLLHGWLILLSGAVLTYYLIYKGGIIPDWPSSLATIFGMGSLAPGTTSYPFAKDMGKMGMLDLGNKIFSLFCSAIVIGKVIGGNLSMKELIFKVLKMPIVISFIGAIVWILFGIKVKNMRITGKFCGIIQTLANPMMLFFIGLKLKAPGNDQLELFVPIFARRTLSMIFLVVLQFILKMEQKEFTTWLVFVNAADSIWPYVHLQAIMSDPNDKSEVDAEYSFQIVIYDYAVAVFLNMIFSSFDIDLEYSIFITVGYALLTIIFGYLTCRNRNKEMKK
jgi:hypothetical protein